MREAVFVRSSRRNLHRGGLLVAGLLGFTGCARNHGAVSIGDATVPAVAVDSLGRDSSGVSLSALVGTVHDSASHRPLGGAQILLRPHGINRAYYSSTDDSGAYAVMKVPGGAYDLLVRKVGYYPYTSVHSFRVGVIDTVRVYLRAAP